MNTDPLWDIAYQLLASPYCRSQVRQGRKDWRYFAQKRSPALAPAELNVVLENIDWLTRSRERKQEEKPRALRRGALPSKGLRIIKKPGGLS